VQARRQLELDTKRLIRNDVHTLAIQSYPSKIAKIGSTVSGKSLLLRGFFLRRFFALRWRSRPLGTVGLTSSSIELFQGSAREPHLRKGVVELCSARFEPFGRL
jgi:hypothetical protein